MPESVRALILVCLCVGFGLFLLKTFVIPQVEHEILYRRVGVWLLLTVAAFLCQNIAVFFLLMVITLKIAVKKEPEPLALFAFLVFSLPSLTMMVSGFGLLEHFFVLSTYRVFTLVLLLPIALTLWHSKETKTLGLLWPDKFLLGYLGLLLGIALEADSLTGALRQALFYPVLDWMIPYFVFSRGVRSLEQLKAILQAFLGGLCLLAIMSCAESLASWKFYLPMYEALDLSFNSPTLYLFRDGTLRSSVTGGHPITLGLIFAVGVSLAMAFFGNTKKARRTAPILVVIGLTGLAFTYSKGPILGAGFGLAVFALSRLRPTVVLSVLVILSATTALLFSGIGDEIRSKLPLIGAGSDEGSVSYRQELLDVGLQIVMQHPWLGLPASVFSTGMESLRQGEGIIDLVNTYLGVALSSGLIGLTLFAGFYLAPMIQLLNVVRSTPEESKLITRSVFAGIAVFLFVIATTSLGGTAQLLSVLLVGWAVSIKEMVSPSKPKPLSFASNN
jgi:O-Antigen ligase